MLPAPEGKLAATFSWSLSGNWPDLAEIPPTGSIEMCFVPLKIVEILLHGFGTGPVY